MSYLENSRPVTLTELARMRAEGEKIAVLTCYDSSFAALLERNGVDVLLVGDSLGNVLQGHGSTLPVTLEQIGCAGIDRTLLAQVAARATAPGETIHNEPFEVTPAMVSDAILAADAAGRSWLKATA